MQRETIQKPQSKENLPSKTGELPANGKPSSEVEQKSKNKKRNQKSDSKPKSKTADMKTRRSKRTKLAVASFILVLAVGVVGNWYYENTDLSKTVKPLINSTKTLGQAELVDATTTSTTAAAESEYFSSARVDRQTARDESLEKLQAVVDSKNESDDAKTQATQKIAEISSYISVENKIETLVKAKGVNNCLAVISSDGSKVDVIVDAEELSDNLIMQVKEIAMQQAGCSFENVSIIQSK